MLAILKLLYGYSQTEQKEGSRFFIIIEETYKYTKGEGENAPCGVVLELEYQYKHMIFKYLDREVNIHLRTQTYS